MPNERFCTRNELARAVRVLNIARNTFTNEIKIMSAYMLRNRQRIAKSKCLMKQRVVAGCFHSLGYEYYPYNTRLISIILSLFSNYHGSLPEKSQMLQSKIYYIKKGVSQPCKRNATEQNYHLCNKIALTLHEIIILSVKISLTTRLQRQ